jgi:solute carrier family 25 S-adenosylmethionine transporter 26
VGALAGAVTGVLTTPLDVIKTRMMTQGVSGRYSSIVDCATKIAKEEGAAAFLKVRF